MTRKILLSTVAIATLMTTNASALTVEEKITKLESIINTQQKEINSLKETTEDIEEMDERLETVETSSLTDKIQLGLGMRVEMNNYSNTYADGTSYDANGIWRTKLNINMKSKIADNLKFSGRLSMYKNWGDSTERMIQNDSMQGRKPDGSQMYVERAYLDWSLNKGSTIPVIVTMGRQPSSDGPSYQIKEDTTRKGTYDALAFDGAADGIVFTALLNKISKGTSIRYAYGTPNVLDNEANTDQQMSYSGIDNSSFENTSVTGVFLDQTFTSLPFENLAQVYTVSAKNLNANSAYDQNTSTPQKNDINVGDLTITGFMVEASKINGNLDLFAHYSRSEAKPNGENIDMDGATSGQGKDHLGLLSSTDNDTTTKSGNATWLGARYTINNNWKVGAEWNKGSKNWFSFTSGSNDPLNKPATRGTATEVYATMKVNRNANLRVGMVNIDYDYTGSGSHLGAPTKISTMTAMSGSTVTIDKTSNAYITFNVLF